MIKRWPESFAAQSALYQVDRFHEGSQPVTLGLVSVQRGLDRMRRNPRTELGPDGPVAAPRAFKRAGIREADRAATRRSLPNPRCLAGSLPEASHEVLAEVCLAPPCGNDTN